MVDWVHTTSAQLSEHLPFLSMAEIELQDALEMTFFAGVIVGLTFFSFPDPDAPDFCEGVDGVPLAPAPALSVVFSVFG